MQTVSSTTIFQQQLTAYIATPEVGNIQDPTDRASAEELLDLLQRHKTALTGGECDTLDLLYDRWKSRLCRLDDEELKGSLLDKLTTPSRLAVQKKLAALALVNKDQLISFDEKRELVIPSSDSLVTKLFNLLHVGNAPQQKTEPTDAEVGDVFLQYLAENRKYIDEGVSGSLDALHAYWRRKKVMQVVAKLSELLLKWHPFHKLLACVSIVTQKQSYVRPPAILAAIDYEETGGRFCKIRRLCSRAWINLPIRTVVQLRAFSFTLHMEERANRLAKLVRVLIEAARWDEARLIVSEYKRRSSVVKESLLTHFQGEILSNLSSSAALSILQNLALQPRFLCFQKHWDPVILSQLPSVDTLQAWLHHDPNKNLALCAQIAKMPNLDMLALGVSDPTRTNELFVFTSLRGLKIRSLTLSNVTIPQLHCDFLATLTDLVFLTVIMPICKIDNAASVSCIVQYVPCTITHLQLRATAEELRLCFTYLKRFIRLRQIFLDPIDDDQEQFQKEAMAHYKLKN